MKIKDLEDVLMCAFLATATLAVIVIVSESEPVPSEAVKVT